MDIYLCYAGEIVVNFFETAFAVLIMTYQLDLKRKTGKIYLLLFYLGLVLIQTIHNYTTGNGVVIIFIMPVFYLLYAVIFLKNPLIFKVFWVVYISSIMFVADMLSVSIVNLIYPGIPYTEFLSLNIYRFLALLFSKSLESVLLIILLKYKLHYESPKKLTAFINVGAMIMLLVVTVVLVYPFDTKSGLGSADAVLGIVIVLINSQILALFYLLFKDMDIGNKQEVVLDEQTKKRLLYEAYLALYHKGLQQQFDWITKQEENKR